MLSTILLVLGILLGFCLGFVVCKTIYLHKTNTIGTFYMTKDGKEIDVYLEYDSAEALNSSYNSDFVTAKVKRVTPNSH